MDEELRKVQKLYGNRAMFFAIIVGFILILADQAALGKGLILGALFSVINFVIMGLFLGKQVADGQKLVRAGSSAFLSLFVRLVILSIPLIISFKLESIDILGTIVGVFMIQLTILFSNLVIDRFLKTRKA